MTAANNFCAVYEIRIRCHFAFVNRQYGRKSCIYQKIMPKSPLANGTTAVLDFLADRSLYGRAIGTVLRLSSSYL